MAVPLLTTWQVETLAGEPTATVSVKNLQSIIQGPHDAWGRQGKPQPLLVSAEVSLLQPFGSSSSSDTVDSDTVHYGLLSKAILATLARMNSENKTALTLHGVLDSIWTALAGVGVDGEPVAASSLEPFLNTSLVRKMSVSVKLPKASLLGSGVELSASAVFDSQGSRKSAMEARAMTLGIQNLSVPTLIGINDNERKAKQIIVMNLVVEKYSTQDDAYTSLETVVEEILSKSDYGTLEALTTELVSKTAHRLKEIGEPPSQGGWQVRIGLEKPTAVPFADAPRVELRVNTNDL